MKDKERKDSQIDPRLKKYTDMWSWLTPNSGSEETENSEEDEGKGWQEGISEQELADARKEASITNGIATLAVCWLLFYPGPYALLLTFASPLIALFVVSRHRGIIKIAHQSKGKDKKGKKDKKKKSVPPSVFIAFFLPALMLAIKAYYGYRINDYSEIWLKVIVATILLLTLFLITQNQIKFRISKNDYTFLIVLGFGLCYGFSSVIIANSEFDNTEPQHYVAEVLSKEIKSTRNRRTKSSRKSYYLKVTDWTREKGTKKVRVSKKIYDRVNTRDEINISQKEGALGIRSYSVSSKKKK